jgi:hypothetical protein
LPDGAALDLSAVARRCPRSTRIRCGRCTRRSGSWLSPTIFCPEGSNPGSGNEARDDRKEPPELVGRGAMPPAVDLPVVVLYAPQGETAMKLDLVDRQAVPGHPVLRRPADDVTLAERGPCREPQAHPAADAAHGEGGPWPQWSRVSPRHDADLSETRHQQPREGPQDLPLSAGWAASGRRQVGKPTLGSEQFRPGSGLG